MMNKRVKYMFRYSLWLAVFALLAVQGCGTIDDDHDCVTPVTLRLEYTYNISGADLLRSQVESMDLYAYDRKGGALVATRRYTQAELAGSNYRISLQWLGLGDYYVVAFGNRNDMYYSCSGYETMSGLRMKTLCSDGRGTVTTNPGTLFYGMTEIGRGDTGEKPLSLKKNTNNINITVRNKVTRADVGLGLPDLTISIAVRNGTLKWDNTIAGDDQRLMNHVSDCGFGEYAAELKTTLTVGRLFSGDGSLLTIKEQGSGMTLTEGNLTGKIIQLLTADAKYDGMAPDEYLDRQDNYDLVYDLEMRNRVLVMTLISIGNWNVVEDPTGAI